MKIAKIYQSSLLICLSACLAAACSFMSPQPDRTQYYVLSPAQSDSTAPSASSTAQLAIGVGPIRFPGYLKRPGVVTRTTSNQLKVSDDNRWAEPLDENFESTLCQNLSRMLGTSKISVYPWYADSHIDYQVEIWVDHFEATDDGRSQLLAVWTIVDGRDGKTLASSQSVQSAPIQGGDGSAALSQDLAALSREIADRIATLAQSRPSA
jgi:uncharacterized protein